MFTGSKKEVLDIIKRLGSVTMDEITIRSELSKTTLREHLLQLERDGYIQRNYLRSGPGRPRLSYRLTTNGHQLFPSSEGDLLRGLLNYLKQEGNEEMIEDFFKLFWDQRLEKARVLLQNIQDGGIREKMTALSEMLENEGFMPEFEISSTLDDGTDSTIDLQEGTEKVNRTDSKNVHSIKIRECNCPYSQAIRETRLPCKLEALFFEKLFHQNMERTSYIADGEHACTYEFEISD